MFYTKLLISGFILILGISQSVISQTAKEMSYKVVLVQKNDSVVVPYATIKNLSNNDVQESDDRGVVLINGFVGDTLKFHCLGFEEQLFCIPGVWEAMGDNISLEVTQMSYAIKQVDIIREYTYAQFVHAFRNMKIEETDDMKMRNAIISWKEDMKEAIAKGEQDRRVKEMQNGWTGASVSITRYDKITRQRMEVKRLHKIAEESKEFYQLTSRENLKLYTGYDGICLDSFIIFFNSQSGANYKMNTLDLIAAISNTYKDFKDLYQDEQWYVCDSLQIE